jgi:hypothetical protein
MPKTIIEFSAEEELDLQFCLNGAKYYNALIDMHNYLRSRTKYPPDDIPDQVLETLYDVHEYFNSILNENNVEI